MSVGNDSNKTILDTLQLTKMKSREIPKQGVTVAESTNKAFAVVRHDLRFEQNKTYRCSEHGWRKKYLC